MIFSQIQIDEILRILDYQSAFLIATQIGTDMLVESELNILEEFDTSVVDLYNQFPPAIRSFYFGRLTQQIGDLNSKKITYKDFLDYLKNAQYIPLSPREKSQLNLVRQLSCSHIRNLGTRIKQTTNSIIVDEDLKSTDTYEKVLKGELERAVITKRSLKSIVSEIGHKTGNWERDWGRIVETEMNNIFQAGRLEQIYKKEGGETLVYKVPYPDACKYCIKFYLTNGIGSKPRVFKLKDLVANGMTNVGRLQKDWKPVVGSVHPYCRCTLHHLDKGKVWDPEQQDFIYKKKEKKIRKSKAKITVGNKVFEV